MTTVRTSNRTTPSPSSCGPPPDTSHLHRAGTRRSAVARPAAVSCAPLSWRVRPARPPLSSPYPSCAAHSRSPYPGRSPSLRPPRALPRPRRPLPGRLRSFHAPTPAPRPVRRAGRPVRRPGRPVRRQSPPRPRPYPRPPRRSAGRRPSPHVRARGGRRRTRRAPRSRRPPRGDLLPLAEASTRSSSPRRAHSASGRGAADRLCLTYRLVSSARISGRPVSMPCRAWAATSAAATF